MASRYANALSQDIIPTETMIKNIPRHWKTGDLLLFMSQVNLPPPSAVHYLYDMFDSFRGMAFVTFDSSDEARQMIQKLNDHRVGGQTLNVQYRRNFREAIASENLSPIAPFHSVHFPCSDLRDNVKIDPQAKKFSTLRPTREQTPPSETFALLMGYQNELAEKEKLGRFLAQTGDYQQAVNEFAKNRVRESHEGGFEIPPILDTRPATPEEPQQIADMESRFGPWTKSLRGGCSSSGVKGNMTR